MNFEVNICGFIYLFVRDGLLKISLCKGILVTVSSFVLIFEHPRSIRILNTVRKCKVTVGFMTLPAGS